MTVGQARQSEDDSISEFDGYKWQMGVKVVGCSNRKALNLQIACIHGLDVLRPGIKIVVVPIGKLCEPWGGKI